MADGNLVGAVLYLSGSDTIIHLYESEGWALPEIVFSGDSEKDWMDLGDGCDTESEDVKAWVEHWRRRAELIHASLYIQKDLAETLDEQESR